MSLSPQTRPRRQEDGVHSPNWQGTPSQKDSFLYSVVLRFHVHEGFGGGNRDFRMYLDPPM